jgi:hypothetical protein
MIRASIDTIRAIEKGAALQYVVIIGFQQPEVYTDEDCLLSAGDISQSMSGEGAYEIQNTTVTLKNIKFYFSRKFARELPNAKPVTISIKVAGQTIELFSGAVGSNWNLSSTELSLPVLASMLLDTVKLRSSAVYQAQAEIKPLQIVYGDLSSSIIPCLQIDTEGLIFHISDRSMQVITGIYDADGQELTAGVTAYPAYQDETGHAIACLIFDRPQPGKKFTVSGKGAEDEAGTLIQLPADFYKDIILNVQGYDKSAIDSADLARFYSDCLASGIEIGFVLGEEMTVKQLFDELSRNIHAFSMLSNGKTVFRLKGTASTTTAQYDFLQDDITDFKTTSGELIN